MNVPQELARIDAGTHALAKKASALEAEAQAFTVETRADFLACADRIRDAKKLERELEDRRTSVTGPMNDALRIINGWFKPFGDSLKAAGRIYSDKAAKFKRAEDDRIRAEQAEADRKAREQREEMERRARKAADAGKTERAMDLLAKSREIAPAPATIAPVKAAGISFTERYEVEVVDANLVPREFCMPDVAKIGARARADKNKAITEHDIPGIRVTVRQSTSTRT